MSSDFERLVARAMREPTDGGTPCPSAETLASYLEGTLRGGEHASVELHASRCSRCAAHLAALVQLEDQLAAGAPPPAPWWRRRPWLVTAAAAVLAGVVWTSLPRERVSELTRPATSETSRANAEQDKQSDDAVQTPIAQAPSMAAPSPAAPLSRTVVPPAPTGIAAPPAKPREREAPQANELADEVGNAPSRAKVDRTLESKRQPPAPEELKAQPQVGDERWARVGAERRALEEKVEAAAPARPAPSAAAAAPRPAAPAAAAPETSQATGNVAGSAAAFARDDASPPAVADAAAPEQKRALRQESAIALGPGLVTSAADSKVAWRVTGGRVERTADGGALWIVERAPLLAPPIVGSSPSREVCWLAGAGSQLLRRDTNGAWARVPVPADVVVASIDARSALEASLTGTNGRRFATTDGGRTWKEVR